jgi:hypothetical protein
MAQTVVVCDQRQSTDVTGLRPRRVALRDDVDKRYVLVTRHRRLGRRIVQSQRPLRELRAEPLGEVELDRQRARAAGNSWHQNWGQDRARMNIEIGSRSGQKLQRRVGQSRVRHRVTRGPDE